MSARFILALAKSALRASIRFRFAPVRSAPARFAPRRIAACRLAPARLAPARLAPAKFARLRNAPPRSQPAQSIARCARSSCSVGPGGASAASRESRSAMPLARMASKWVVLSNSPSVRRRLRPNAICPRLRRYRIRNARRTSGPSFAQIRLVKSPRNSRSPSVGAMSSHAQPSSPNRAARKSPSNTPFSRVSASVRGSLAMRIPVRKPSPSNSPDTITGMSYARVPSYIRDARVEVMRTGPIFRLVVITEVDLVVPGLRPRWTAVVLGPARQRQGRRAAVRTARELEKLSPRQLPGVPPQLQVPDGPATHRLAAVLRNRRRKRRHPRHGAGQRQGPPRPRYGFAQLPHEPGDSSPSHQGRRKTFGTRRISPCGPGRGGQR